MTQTKRTPPKNIVLYGSLTSPYVRRLRLFLDGYSYELRVLNDIFGADNAALNAVNPVKRVPVMQYGNEVVWESRIIHQVLRRELGFTQLSLEQENMVSVIDAWQDQLIQKFLLTRYQHPIDLQNPYFARHGERERLMSSYLDSCVLAHKMAGWDYPEMALASLLEWSLFRKVLDERLLSPALVQFGETQSLRQAMKDTAPPL
jgi:glutathione S-transferase